MKETADFDPQPTLEGQTLLLRPLRVEDFDALYAVAADPAIWEQHPEPTRYRQLVFEGFFTAALASRGALLAIDRASGAVMGSSRYYDWDPAGRSVAIGYTFLARSHWGGAANREMKRLMLDHAFGWAETVWFHVGKENHRSRRAMEKLGAQLALETQREHGGVPHDYVYYRMDAKHWRRDQADAAAGASPAR